MEPLSRIEGVAAPLFRGDIDTDTIIPSREMKTVSKRGLADGLFAGWRYSRGEGCTPDPDFVLNKPDYAGARILVAGPNFGCGSSREHAVWALKEYGIQAILAPSFARIFFANCIRNGVLPAVLGGDEVAQLVRYLSQSESDKRLVIDLERRALATATGLQYRFTLDARSHRILREGKDPIAQTLEYDERIEDFLSHDRERRPWIYGIAQK